MKWNFCPYCGHRTYQHTTEGCTHVTQTHHIAAITNNNITIKHPLAEREEDRLFDCKVLAQITKIASEDSIQPGTYACIDEGHTGETGYWTFRPVSEANQICNCTSLHE
jgi:hypothetical protein